MEWISVKDKLPSLEQKKYFQEKMMRNRAKCKLCNDIIESFTRIDYVECSCGEIAIDGGNQYYKAAARDFKNFMRIDDLGKEIEVTVQEKDVEPIKENKDKPTKQELFDMLDEMIKSIDRLPDNAMTQPINHYDWYSTLTLISALFRASS